MIELGSYYGIVGNGIANDSPGVNNAIEDAMDKVGTGNWDLSGVSVFCPPPEVAYNLESPVYVPLGGIGLFSTPSRGAKFITYNNINMFVVGDPTEAVATWKVNFHHLFLHAMEGNNTATAIKAYRAMGGSLYNCVIRNFDHGFHGIRANRWNITENFFNGNRSTQGTAHLRFSASSTGSGGGVHVTNNELGQIGSSLKADYDAAIRVDSIDGLYLINNHSRDVNHGLKITPDGGVNNKVTDIKSCHDYFDENHVSPVLITGQVSSGGLYQEITFTDTLMRCGNQYTQDDYADYGIDIDVTDAGGFVSSGGSLKNIRMHGGVIRLARYTGIRAAGSSAGRIEVDNLDIQGVTFDRNNVSGEAATSGITAEVKSYKIANNTFQADTVQANQNIRMSVSGSSGSLNDNNFTDSNAKTHYVTTADSGACLFQSDNQYPGRGRGERELYKAKTVSRSPVMVWSRLIDPNGQLASLEVDILGSSVDSTECARYQYSALIRRVPSGSATFASFKTVSAYDNITASQNDAPAVVSFMTGDDWVANANTAAGKIIKSGGNCYLNIVAQTLPNVAPTHTSGVTNGLGYIGPVAPNTLAVIVSGTSSAELDWMCDLSYKVIA